MASLSHQSAINPDRNYWVAATPGISSATQFAKNPMPYLEPLIFEQNQSAPITVEDQGSVTGAFNALFIQSPTGVNFAQAGVGTTIATTINTDATFQNQFPGIATSTIVTYGDRLIGTGHCPTGQQLTLVQRDSADNELQNLSFYMPRNQSTMNIYNYASKDNFMFNNLTSPIMQINPYAQPQPVLGVPTYLLSTSAMNVSSINGGFVPPDSGLIDLLQPTLNNDTYTQGVRAIGTQAIPGLVAGGYYLYDVAVDLATATANNAGAAPTFPFNLVFGVRLGGSGSTFDYGNTVQIDSSNQIGNGGVQFVLSGIVQAGTTNNNLDVVMFFNQVDTTATVSFASIGDPRMYLKRLA